MPRYTGISSEAFRHPLDRQAEQSLRSVPGFDLLASKFIEFLYERPQLIYHTGNSIQVGARQYSTLYGIFRETVKDLDVSPEPILFVSQNPVANAYSMGQEHPYIVINSGLLDLLTEAEIRVAIAHELGHIKCGHTILSQMAMWAMSIASAISEMTFGIGNLVSSGLIYAFFEWRRKAELVMTCMMKISGGSKAYMHELSLPEFVRQSQAYQELDRENLNQAYKFLLYNGGVNSGSMLSHPFPVDRIHYLQEWAISEEYRQIKKGNYKYANATGAVDIENPQTEADRLRREIEELQKQINNMQK
jgi:Zn-dependent protease with chaperone function